VIVACLERLNFSFVSNATSEILAYAWHLHDFSYANLRFERSSLGKLDLIKMSKLLQDQRAGDHPEVNELLRALRQ
jgi:hypothetical protein